ncbi:MAG: S8 family serine peptidase [Mariprofundaceae bacterium]
MKVLFRCAVLCGLLLIAVSTSQAGAVQKDLKVFKPATSATQSNQVDSIIIKLKPFSDSFAASRSAVSKRISQRGLQRLRKVSGAKVTYFRMMSGGLHVLKLPNLVSAVEAEKIAGKLSGDPDVEYAEPDYRVYARLIPNDPEYVNQTHYHSSTLHGMNLPGAWDLTTGSASAVTAILDTGVLNHSDLTAKLLPGYDMVSDLNSSGDGDGRDSDATDPGGNSLWHGTHVAGTVGAATNNGIGVAGVDWLGKILPVRVLDTNGSGLTSDTADGMRWAAGLAVAGVPNNLNPAKVLNLSLGSSSPCGVTYQNAIDDVNAAGVLVVNSAGNTNVDAGGSRPSGCNGDMLVVGAHHDLTSEVTDFSNFGKVVDILAPGLFVLSTYDSGSAIAANDDSYQYVTGTSMAAPHISGLAALVFARNPALTVKQVMAVIKGTARPFVAGGWCARQPERCGVGIADAQAAVEAALTADSAPTSLALTSPSISQVDLSWVDHATTETAYKVERRDGSAAVYNQIGTLLSANITNYSDGTTVANETYYYRVRAVLPGGDTHASNEVWVTQPSPPSLVTPPSFNTPNPTFAPVDTTPPVISLTGNATIIISAGDIYVDAGATAEDMVDGNLTSALIVGNPVPNPATAGIYTVMYNVTDRSGLPALQVTRTVQVNGPVATVTTVAIDPNAPVITLTGQNTVYLMAGDSYVDQGATAIDLAGGVLTQRIATNNPVSDPTVEGVFTIIYNVSDTSGNRAVQVSRTVHVTTEGASVSLTDSRAPVLSLLGVNTVVLSTGASYEDDGATAMDLVDGDLTAAITVNNPVPEPAKEGTYTVIYNVVDTHGNHAVQISRIVQVITPLALLAQDSQTEGASGVSESGCLIGKNGDAPFDSLPMILLLAVIGARLYERKKEPA